MTLTKLSYTAALFSALLLMSCKDEEIGIAPTITLSEPAANTFGVSVGQPITITFSETMDPATINVSSIIVTQNDLVVPGIVVYTNSKAAFNATEELLKNQLYIVTITTGVRDQSGNALANNYTFSFKTGTARDDLSPLISLTDPLNDVGGIPRNKSITIQFSEAMEPTTVNSFTFILKQGEDLIPGSVSSSGTTATFTPHDALTAVTRYTATITTDATDLAGNALASNSSWDFTTGGTVASLSAIDLGESGNFVILAKTAISNVSTSAVTGNMGLSPAATSYVTGLSITNAAGYATSAQVAGKIYAADMAKPTPVNLTTAIDNMLTAYRDAADRTSPDFTELADGSIGGRTLMPGLYNWSSTVTIQDDIVIKGGPNDIWIFQIAGNLSVGSSVNVILSGGAQVKNIFWQTAGEATLGTAVHFEGTILSMTGITLQSGASITGRALAQTAVILDANSISIL